MTSEQTEALQNLSDAGAAYAARCDELVRAFGTDHPDIATIVTASGQQVGETVHTLAVWKAALKE